MILEIEDSQLTEDLKQFISEEGETKKFDVSKLKSQADIDRILGAKQHVDQELSALKAKYKDVDVENYKSLMAQQLEANKDVLQNPIYKNLDSKFTQLTADYQALKQELENRDTMILDSELKELIRGNTEIQQSAIEDLFYRAKCSGFQKTEKGFLNSQGKTVDEFINELKPTAKHLFKVSNTRINNEKIIKDSVYNRDLNAIFQNLQQLN
jgi:hypothetical protein